MTVKRVFCSVALLPLLLLALGCHAIPGVGNGSTTTQDFSVKVDAQSNVFGSGAGGLDANGEGKTATAVTFEARSGMVLSFSSVSGRVSCCSGGEAFNDADGGDFAGGVTDIESSGGISGITHPNKTMFLVGVFLDDKPPKPPGPARLNANDPKNLTPQLYQTFFIGTGKAKQFEVPATATHLVLGFADASNFTGAPGAYLDNVGELSVKFSIGRSDKTR